jgi:hypothetical protein
LHKFDSSSYVPESYENVETSDGFSMKQLSFIFLSLLLGAYVVPWFQLVGAESPSKQLSNNYVNSVSAEPRPPQVWKVSPPDKSTHTSVPIIRAELDFTAGEAVEPSSLQIFVDGVDVTSQAQIGGSRDWPPSYLHISYTPKDFRQGSHCAEIRFRTKKGRTNSYQWSFSIKSH